MSPSSADLFEVAFPRSRPLARLADRVIAGGVCHDSWRLAPYPLAFAAGDGAYKTAVDGPRLIDLWMGHGALMLGHAPASIVEALRKALAEASHLAGLLPAQVAWAEMICKLVPSAQRVRFTASGTEGTLLAMRVTRAFTGRRRVVKIDGHFHGWHDEALCGHYDARSFGLDEAASETVAIAPPGEPGAVAELAAQGDVAAIMLEPGGGSSSTLPYDPVYLQDLRAIADGNGCLLVFDEVVTGFRVAPGGIQALSGVTPDLTVLAKILCGGFPGGAVVGRDDVMQVFAGDSLRKTGSAVVHSGTFNGHPLAAVAGTETLRLLESGAIQRSAAERAKDLASAVNAGAREAGIDVRMFHQSSIVHLVVGAVQHGVPPTPGVEAVRLQRRYARAHDVLRRILLVEGIDMHPMHGWLSAAHDSQVTAELVSRFARAFDRLRQVSDWPSDLA